MGIQDREYMKRRSSHEADRGESLQESLGGFLERHPRFFRYLGFSIAALAIIAIIVASL